MSEHSPEASSTYAQVTSNDELSSNKIYMNADQNNSRKKEMDGSLQNNGGRLQNVNPLGGNESMSAVATSAASSLPTAENGVSLNAASPTIHSNTPTVVSHPVMSGSELKGEESHNSPGTLNGTSVANASKQPNMPNATFRCDKCDMMFVKQSGLTNHKRTYHQVETVVIIGHRRYVWRRNENGRFQCVCGRQNWRRPVNFASHAKQCPSFLAMDPNNIPPEINKVSPHDDLRPLSDSRRRARRPHPSDTIPPGASMARPDPSQVPESNPSAAAAVAAAAVAAAANLTNGVNPPEVPRNLNSSLVDAAESLANVSQQQHHRHPFARQPDYSAHSIPRTAAPYAPSMNMFAQNGPNTSLLPTAMPSDVSISSSLQQQPIHPSYDSRFSKAPQGTDALAALGYGTPSSAATLCPLYRDTPAAIVSEKLHLRLANLRIAYCEDCREFISLNAALDHRRSHHQQNITGDLVHVYSDFLDFQNC